MLFDSYVTIVEWNTGMCTKCVYYAEQLLKLSRNKMKCNVLSARGT